jgi:hypothetical protein
MASDSRTCATDGRRYLGLDLLARCRLTSVTDPGTEANTDTVLELGV